MLPRGVEHDLELVVVSLLEGLGRRAIPDSKTTSSSWANSQSDLQSARVQLRGWLPAYRSRLVGSSASSLRATAPRLEAGSIRLTIDWATLGLKALGPFSSGRAR